MTKYYLLAGAIWLSLTASVRAQSLPRLQAGMAYGQARLALVEKGWRPVNQLRRFQAQPLTPVIVYLYSLGYLEVVGCNPEGWCSMEFVHSRGRRLTVITRGNHPDNDAGPLLEQWYIEDETKGASTSWSFGFLEP